MADQKPAVKKPTNSNFPSSGQASTYADYFERRTTSNGDTYRHSGYTAALLPRSHWHSFAMGTLLRLTYRDRQVIVKVNDRGAGKVINGVADDTRVLDLSRAAMAYLIGVKTEDITDDNASVITLDKIEVMPLGTPVGPVQQSKK
jgi:rare lipoprotein A (peptidoglycan hydrolase)